MKYSIQTLNKISKAGTDRFCDAYTQMPSWSAAHPFTTPLLVTI